MHTETRLGLQLAKSETPDPGVRVAQGGAASGLRSGAIGPDQLNIK